MTLTYTETVLTTEAVTETVSHNWTEDDIREYFSLDDRAAAEGQVYTSTKKLRDTYLESFILLGQGTYKRESAENLIVLLGINRSVNQVKKYHLAGKVMAALGKGDKDTARKVWTEVEAASKVAKYGLLGAESALELMPEGSTWGDWIEVVRQDRASYGDPLKNPMLALERSNDDAWTPGYDARLILLCQRRGFTVTK